MSFLESPTDPQIGMLSGPRLKTSLPFGHGVNFYTRLKRDTLFMTETTQAITQEESKNKATKTFADFDLPAALQQALARIQFTTPTPIQEQTLPLALAGQDILGSAQTGTGKTGAFGIPMIAGLINDPKATALILTPTRELAMQVMATLQQMISVPNIRTALLIGGEAMPKQFKQLNAYPRLIVGTPGRVIDHLSRGRWNLNDTRYLVLDETDRMLDMGFGIQLDRILEYVPQERQTMMFSATMPSNIMKMSAKYLNNPQRVSIGSTVAPATKIKQELVRTTEDDKYNQLVNQLENREGSVIIFVKTKYGAEKLATKLYRAEHKADAIHGDLKQNQRSRVIQAFREKKYRILVATDVAARGLDIPHIEHVINYDLPQCPEDYIHRIGRTARAGAEGSAVNLLSPMDNSKWNAIQRMLNPNEKPQGQGRGQQGRSDQGRGRRSGNDSQGRSYFGARRSTRDDAYASIGRNRSSEDGYRKDNNREDGYRSEGRSSRFNEQGFKSDRFKQDNFKQDGFRQDSFRQDGAKPYANKKPSFKQDYQAGEGERSSGGFRQDGYKKPGFKQDGFKKDFGRSERPSYDDRGGRSFDKPFRSESRGDAAPSRGYKSEGRSEGSRSEGSKPFGKEGGFKKPFAAKGKPFGQDGGFKRKEGGFKKKFSGPRKSAA
jgi:ATP-dependent RNA helicase DeaD